MTATRYTTLFFTLSALILSMVGLGNWLVDPFYLFRSADIPGANQLRSEFFNYQLLSKPYALLDYEAEVLMLGSSRTGTALRPNHQAFAGMRVYNGALAGSTLRANILQYRHANSAHKLKKVLINPDFYMFNAYQRPGNPGAYRDFERRLLINYDGTSNYRRLAKMVGDHLDSLLAWNTIKSSYRTVLKQKAIAAGDSPYLTIHPDGHWTNRVAPHRLHADYFKQIERIYIPTGWVPANSSRFAFRRDGATSGAPIDDFRWFLNDAYDNDIEVIITFMPYHARLLEAMHLIGVWQQSEEWKRLIVASVEEVAAERDREAFPVWDFTGYNSINMDPLPRADARGNHMRWYRDASHVRQHTGDLIIDRIMNFETTERIAPADFGVRLNSKNIDAHLSSINTRRSEFLDAFPEDVNEIRATVTKADALDIVR
jgi:hypothetical protein